MRCRPIPPLTEPPNWARLSIKECGEPLVPLTEGPRLRVRSLYAEMGIPGAPETLSVRVGVWDRILQAVASLPEDIALLVFDGFRPLAVQQYLYDGYWSEVAAAEPGLTVEEITARVALFVAAPNADPSRPPPHRTGGAIDVYLVDARIGTPLPMGTEPDETSPASRTRFFEENLEEPITTNRRLLFHAMTGAGFTNYCGEWWHYDWGNQRWANCVGREHALYGIADSPVG